MGNEPAAKLKKDKKKKKKKKKKPATPSLGMVTIIYYAKASKCCWSKGII